MKSYLKKKLYNFIFNLNLSFHKINDFDKLIYLINRENNNEKKNNLINTFIDKYPNHWLPYYKKLTFLHYNNLTNYLKYIDLYDQKYIKFYKQNLLINKNFEIIDSSVYFGSIGNFYALETLIKSNLLGLKVIRLVLGFKTALISSVLTFDFSIIGLFLATLFLWLSKFLMCFELLNSSNSIISVISIKVSAFSLGF